MQVLLSTRYGNLFRWNYEAGKADSYGNSNEPVVADDGDGPYCVIHCPSR